jgi:hypothetical protein
MARQVTDEVVVENGTLVGPLRRSVNQAQDVATSIHNDATASKLGFRGGTVAGSIHLELFPPLLVRAFGQGWFERGTLSINFRNATTDREPVRAFLKQPGPGTQVAAWVERDDGMLVGEGSASAGESEEPTALQKLDLHRFDAGELRILADLRQGEEIAAADVHLDGARQRSRLDVITEPLDWYAAASPWGGPVASPATIVELLYAHPARVIGRGAGPAVGLFGAIEVEHVNGPVLLDRDYRVGGTVLALGQSPKTEYVWFESHAQTPDGERVAQMRMQLRWMKASSPQYPE